MLISAFTDKDHPSSGFFYAAVVLGDKAVQAAKDLPLPDHIRQALDSARRYAEGTGLRFEVHSHEDIEAAEMLAVVKMA